MSNFIELKIPVNFPTPIMGSTGTPYKTNGERVIQSSMDDLQGFLSAGFVPTDPVLAAVVARPALLGLGQSPVTVTAAALSIPNDPSKFYLMNSASAQLVTVPAGLPAWTPGMTINLPQIGTGLTSVVSVGATINGAAGVTHAGKGQYTVPQLLNIGLDTWMVTGGLN